MDAAEGGSLGFIREGWGAFLTRISQKRRTELLSNQQLPPLLGEKECWVAVDDFFIRNGAVLLLSLPWNCQRHYTAEPSSTHGAEKPTLLKSLGYKERLLREHLVPVRFKCRRWQSFVYVCMCVCALTCAGSENDCMWLIALSDFCPLSSHFVSLPLFFCQQCP